MLVRVTSRSLYIRCCICVGLVSPFLVARFVWVVGMAVIAAFFMHGLYVYGCENPYIQRIYMS
jgi:hypothetical protein